ncbi:hypothetical protein ACXYTJ_15260 [Gilvimarinus sp. F26214L]|uniref:hypothetical protein n=1 Tax=Gilvimarinus sp. DZF01 TaxID=3461371 RepID=UPI004046593F
MTLTALLFAALSASALAADEDGKKEAESAQKGQAEKQAKQKADEGPIRLESVFVGDKEQPAISYFIPWQGIGTPDKLHWNVEERHDKALGTVDREIMLRSIELYDQMQLEAPPQ